MASEPIPLHPTWQVWASLGRTWKPVTDWVVLQELLWTCGRVNRFGPRWQTVTELSGKLGFCFINVVIQQVGARSRGDSSITAETLCIWVWHLGSMNVHNGQSSGRYASSYFGFPQNLASFFPRHVYLCSESLAQETSILSDWSASSKCACSCVVPPNGLLSASGSQKLLWPRRSRAKGVLQEACFLS